MSFMVEPVYSTRITDLLSLNQRLYWSRISFFLLFVIAKDIHLLSKKVFATFQAKTFALTRIRAAARQELRSQNVLT
jgi:hypothetical protein